MHTLTAGLTRDNHWCLLIITLVMSTVFVIMNVMKLNIPTDPVVGNKSCNDFLEALLAMAL